MRSTFSCLRQCSYQLSAASVLLGVTGNTLLNYLKNSGIEIERRAPNNPKAPKSRKFSLDDIFRLASWRREMGLVKTVSSMPLYVALSSMKVGAGKSTTAAELGTQLQLSGYRVLLIDLDIRAKLTQYMGYESDLLDDEAEINGLYPEAIIKNTFFDFCQRNVNTEKPGFTSTDDNFASHVKWPFGCCGPALIPADPFIGYLERVATFTRGGEKLLFPNFFKASAEGMVPGLQVKNFDVVLFDCPASMNYIVSNAFAMADYVVAPVRLDHFGVKGIAQIVNEVKGFERNSSKLPELIFLPTHCSVLNANAIRMWNRLENFKDSIAEISISSTDLFARAQKLYVPLTIQLPKSLPAMEYRKLTDYLIRRFNARKNFLGSKEIGGPY